MIADAINYSWQLAGLKSMIDAQKKFKKAADLIPVAKLLDTR